MKLLKRKYAHLCLLLLVCGIIFFWIPFFFPAGPGKLFILAGIFLILCSLAVKYSLLKCPKCGFRGLIPQWKGTETCCCPKCGDKIKWE